MQEKIERIAYIKDSFNTLRMKGIIKTQGDFASLLGIAERSLSAAKNGDDRYLTDSLIARIKGVMDQMDGGDTAETIPVIPVEAMAGTLQEFFQSVQDYDCERMVSPIKGADYAIKVNGDSMSPEIPNGSHILLKRILEDQFVEWGKIFCLDTANGAVIKRVFPTDDPDVVECRSINPEYPSFKVNTKHINGWYRVLMVMSFK
jgi:SOS-response transcriptional repressor LexA